MKRMGKDFKESDSDSFAMVVLEGQQPLGDDAHTYYAGLVRELRADPKHVEHVQDLWGDRLTAAGAQSPDGKAAYVQLNLAGNQGTTLGQESVAAVRNIVERTPPPPGLKAYVTGPAALISDMQHSGDRSILKMTVIGAVIIFAVLLFVYRSVITVVLLLVTVGIEVFAARGIIAFLGDNNIVALSTFAINLLVALAMAAGTDYGIFFFGRYQEARQAGEDRGNGLLHHLPRGRSRCPGFRSDDRRSNVVLEFYPDAHLPDHRRAVRRGHVRFGRDRTNLGSGGSCRRKRLRAIRPQAQDRVRSMAPGRHGDCPLARAHSRRDNSGRADRSSDSAGLQNELQRPALYTQRHSCQCGVCGRGSSFFPVPDDARNSDDRIKSRYAQSGRFSRVAQASQGDFPGSGHFSGAGHNPARGNTD